MFPWWVKRKIAELSNYNHFIGKKSIFCLSGKAKRHRNTVCLPSWLSSLYLNSFDSRKQKGMMWKYMSIYYNRKHIYRSRIDLLTKFCFLPSVPIMLGLTGLEVFVPKGRIFQQETEKLFLWTMRWYCLLPLRNSNAIELTVQRKGLLYLWETDFSYEVELVCYYHSGSKKHFVYKVDPLRCHLYTKIILKLKVYLKNEYNFSGTFELDDIIGQWFC